MYLGEIHTVGWLIISTLEEDDKMKLVIFSLCFVSSLNNYGGFCKTVRSFRKSAKNMIIIIIII